MTQQKPPKKKIEMLDPFGNDNYTVDVSEQKPNPSAAAEKKLSEKFADAFWWGKMQGNGYREVPVRIKNHSKLADAIDEVKKLEAQQTDDTLRQRIDNAHADIYSVWNGGKLSAVDLNHLESALAILGHIMDELKSPRGDDALSRNNDGIPDIIAHGIMEEVRMQTTQVSTPEEPNYSSDPYYDAECKISEIIAKHRATTGTLSELRTQIEAKEFADLAAEWQKLYDTDRSDYHDKGVTYTTISPSVWLLTHTIKALEVGYHLAKLDSAEARKK